MPTWARGLPHHPQNEKYLNFKGYGEFGEQHRPAGWNAWITLSISPAAQTPPGSAQRPLVRK